MGLAERASYRNGFLRSEKWQGIRYRSLVRWKSECFICLKADFHNDIHHVWYGKDLGKTGPEHTRVLCRSCHNEVHRMMKLDWRFIRFGKPQKLSHAIEMFNRVAERMFSERHRCEMVKDRYKRFEDRHATKIGQAARKAMKHAGLAVK